MTEKSFHQDGSERVCPPTKIEVICDSSILSIKHIISWIVSITVSVTIVIVITWTLVVGGVRTCANEIREGKVIVHYEDVQRATRRRPVAPPAKTICGTVVTVITEITVIITAHIEATIIDTINLVGLTNSSDRSSLGGSTGGGTLGQNPFGMRNSGGQFPLALGGDRVLIEIEDSKKTVPDPANPARDVVAETTRPVCAGPNIGIEVDSDDDNFDDNLVGERDREKRTEKTKWREEDLDLPPFCDNLSNSKRIYWSLLGQPRVHHTRTYIKGRIYDRFPQTGLPAPATEDDTGAKKRAHPDDVLESPAEIYYQTGAPYAVFTAQQKGNPNLLKIFVLYVDFVTERPTLIEIPFESLGGRKSVVNSDHTVHLVNNIKLDSMNHEITFQVGSGVRELTIAGYDFGPESTDTAVLGARNRDASGSFVACLTPDGGIYRVFRIDRDLRQSVGKRKCEIYR